MAVNVVHSVEPTSQSLSIPSMRSRIAGIETLAEFNIEEKGNQGRIAGTGSRAVRAAGGTTTVCYVWTGVADCHDVKRWNPPSDGVVMVSCRQYG